MSDSENLELLKSVRNRLQEQIDSIDTYMASESDFGGFMQGKYLPIIPVKEVKYFVLNLGVPAARNINLMKVFYEKWKTSIDEEIQKLESEEFPSEGFVIEI